MTVVNAAVVTVLSVVLLIYIFITVAIVAKHVIVDTCAVLKKNVTVVKVTIGMMEIRLQIDEITMKIVCLRPGVMVMRNAWLCIVIITSIKCNGVQCVMYPFFSITSICNAMNYFRKKDGRNDLYFSISFKLHCRQGFRPKYCFLSVNAFKSKMIRPLIKCLYDGQNEKHVIAIFVYNLINLKVEICFFSCAIYYNSLRKQSINCY